MAAIRLGTALSSLTGTASQLLRVNAGETGFEFFSPPALPAYTITNGTTDRVMDANNVTVDELADVVSTLIADLGSVINGTGQILEVWTTSFYHPGQSISNYVDTITYDLVHNKGKIPLFTRVISVQPSGDIDRYIAGYPQGMNTCYAYVSKDNNTFKLSLGRDSNCTVKVDLYFN